jgi:hypothetical protein
MHDAEISALADMSAAIRATTAASARSRLRIMTGVRGMGLALRGMTKGRLEEDHMNTIPANLRPTGHARTLTRVSRQTQLYGVVAPYAIGLSDSACLGDALEQIEAIVREYVIDPVGPEFMAPPASTDRRAAEMEQRTG